MKTKKTKIKNGFTLIELLVVVVILGVLATVGLNSFRLSQLKGRDAKRKSDLEQVQRALEMYYNDYGSYPEVISFGDPFEIAAKGTVYMKVLPKDPTGNPEYCYESPGTSYQLYAKLENSQDQKISGPFSCGGVVTYNYGASSSNVEP